MATIRDLRESIIEGAVQRIRPKVMTIAAILFGLLPIMWSPTNQAGADVMKRIAAPMIGGVITSGILELLIYPAIYVIWRRHYLPKETRDEMKRTQSAAEKTAGASTETVETPSPRKQRKGFWKILLLILLLGAIGVGGYFAWKQFGQQPAVGESSGKPFATQKVKDLIVNFINPKGQLQNAMNEILIEFRDSASNELVDVGTVKFDLDMNMPGMVMHNSASVSRSATPGQYRASIKPDMAGDWSGRLQYDGPRGTGAVTFNINVASGPSAKAPASLSNP